MKQRRVGIIRNRDHRRRNQLRQSFGEPAVADQAKLGQHLIEPCPRLRCDAACPVESAPVDCSAIDKMHA